MTSQQTSTPISLHFRQILSTLFFISTCHKDQGGSLIQFTLRTLFLLFVVFWSSLAAFGVWGILVTVLFAAIGMRFQAKGSSFRALMRFSVVFVIIIGLISMFFLPVFATARELARRMMCESNLKQINVGLQLYHDVHGCFPPAYMADKDGRPMHSWRTLVLPNINGTQFYNSYDFKKPWDDINNRKQLLQDDTLIRCPSCANWQPQTTHYVAVTGPGTAWPGDKSIRFKDITDGPSNTILLVEVADSDIHWTEPRDITLEEALGKSGDGTTTVPSSNHRVEGGYFTKDYTIPGHVLMADGSVRCLPNHLSPDDLAALLSINGGEKVNLDQLLEDADFPIYPRLRWDHVIGLPLFLVSLVWFWYRLLQKPVEAES